MLILLILVTVKPYRLILHKDDVIAYYVSRYIAYVVLYTDAIEIFLYITEAILVIIDGVLTDALRLSISNASREYRIYVGTKRSARVGPPSFSRLASSIALIIHV